MSGALRQTALYALATLVARAMPLVTLPLLTHALGPADYGRLEYLAVIAELGGLLAGGGLAAVVFRFAAAGPEAECRRAAAEAIGLAAVLALAALAAGLAFLPVLPGALPVPVSGPELAIVTGSFCLAAFVETPLAVLRAEGRVRLFAGLTILRALVQTAILAALLAAGAGVAGALSAALITSAALAAYLLADRARGGGVALPPSARFRAYLRFGLPMMAGGLVGFLQMAGDRWIVADHLGAEALAQYALAVKVAIVTAVLMRPYDMWWEANRMRLLTGEVGPGAARRALAAGFGLSALTGAAVALGGGLLILWATPAAFHPAAGLVPLAAAAGACHAASAYAGARLYIRASGLPVLAVNAVCAAVTLALCLVAVPRWGLEGALAARLAGAALRIVAFALAARLVAGDSRRGGSRARANGVSTGTPDGAAAVAGKISIS